MDFSKYLSMPNVCIPSEIKSKIEKTGNITALPFSKLNNILENQNLQNEIGTVKLSDGSFLVAMTCLMPSVTKEMVVLVAPTGKCSLSNVVSGRTYQYQLLKKRFKIFFTAVCSAFSGEYAVSR